MLHTLRFSLQNAVYFIMLPFLLPVLFTFYIRSVLKFKCKIRVPKGATYLPMKMEQRECSEMSAYKIQTPGNYPEENIQQW